MSRPSSLVVFLVLLGLNAAPAVAQTTLSGTIFDGSGGPLTAGTYHVTGSLTVPLGTTLSIQPGAILKFANVLITVNGTLTANGATFTSDDDESVGVDVTPTATVGGPGQWSRMVFGSTSDASSLTNCTVRFCGSSGIGAILTSAADITLSNVVIASNLGSGFNVGGNSFPTVTGCSFDGNQQALIGVDLAAVAGFTNNTASGNTAGDSMRVSGGTLGATTAWSVGNSFNQTGSFVVEGSVTIGPTDVLTLGAGCTWKFVTNLILTVQGTLITNGTALDEVVFTHALDDDFGGDSLGDGPTSPVPGQWNRMDLNTGCDASTFTHARIRYAGSAGLAAVRLASTCNPTFLGCVIERSAADAVEFSSTASRPTFTGCAFDDNGAVAVDSVPPLALPGFSGNTATGNGIRDTIDLIPGPITQSLSITVDQSLNGNGVFVLEGSVTVSAFTTLDLGPGVILKMLANSIFTLSGVLLSQGSPGAEVVFTSIGDDAVGGDTNKDGGATLPAPSDWNRVEFTVGSAASVLESTRFRYAGSSGLAGVRLVGADITMRECVVERQAAGGISLNVASFPVIENSRFDDNGAVAIDEVRLDAIPRLRHNTAAGNGGGNYLRVTTPVYSGSVEIHPYNYPGEALVMSTSLSAALHPNTLTFGPGVILKFSLNATITTNGAVHFLGTGSRPVVVTHIRDDAVGGDTNLDGSMTVPAPGIWNRIDLSGSAPSRLENVIVRFGGSSGIPSIRCLDQSTLRAVRVEFSSLDGMTIASSGSNPTNLVAFRNGRDGIVLEATFAGTLVHATCVENGGDGVFRVGGTAQVVNSVSWDNAVLAYSGFASGGVDFSCGNTTPSGAGNITGDPDFFDQALGNLIPRPTSPCVNTAEMAAALATERDFLEHSRLLDPFMSGNALPDMGAHEFFPYRLFRVGEPMVGTNVATPYSLIINGLPGTGILFVGVGDGSFLLAGLGFELAGDISNLAVLSFNLAVDAPYSTLIPNDPSLDGFEFDVQAFAVPSPGLVPGAVGTLTNVLRERIFR